MLLSEADAAQDGFLHKQTSKQTWLHSFHSLEAVIIIACVCSVGICIVCSVPADLGTYFCGNPYFLVSFVGFAHLPTHFIYFIYSRIIIEIGICHDSIETQCPFISIHKSKSVHFLILPFVICWSPLCLLWASSDIEPQILQENWLVGVGSLQMRSCDLQPPIRREECCAGPLNHHLRQYREQEKITLSHESLKGIMIYLLFC